MDKVVDNKPEEDAVEIVDLDEYYAMLEHDIQKYEFEKGEDEFVIDD